MTPADEYTMSELVWLVTHGTQTTRERASAELDRRFPNAAAQPEPPGWQTIESAPRDGSIVLVALSGYPEFARWNRRTDHWETTVRTVNPSHWMPLPEVPR
jgi:hypothetical protein